MGVVKGIISLKDNATGVLRSIRKEQSAFRRDVEATKKELKSAWDKKHKAKMETSAATKALQKLQTRLAPLRKKLVLAVAVKDLASDTIKGIGKKLKELGSLAANSAVGKGLLGSIKLAAAGYGAAAAAATAGLTALFSGSSELAKAQIEAETKLEAVLGNVVSIQARGAGAAAEAKQNLMGVASSLQNIGVIGDEVTLAGMQQLATFQLSDKEISILAPGLTDLMAQQKGLNASQQDAVAYGNLIGKVMQGQTSALSRVGITFDEAQEKALQTGDAEQRAAVLAEILQQNVGGVNKALAETDQGKIQQVANAWGDMKEEVGKVSLSIKSKFSAVVMKNIAPIQKLGTTFLGVLNKIADKALPVVDSAIAMIVPTIDGVLERLSNFSDSSGFIGGLAGVCKAAGPVISGIFSGIGSAAQTFAPVVKTIFTDVAQKVGSVLQFMGSKTGWLQKVISKAAPLIASVVSTAWSVISPVMDIAISTFKLLFNVTSTVFNGILSVVSTVWSKVKPIIDGIAKGLNWISDKVGGLLGDGGSGRATRKTAVRQVGANAKGTDNWRGGLTWVGEQGPELVELPRGTRILPSKASMAASAWPNNRSSNNNSWPAPSARMGTAPQTGGTGSWHITLNIAKLSDSIIVRSEADIDAIGEGVAKKVVQALKNMPQPA